MCRFLKEKYISISDHLNRYFSVFNRKYSVINTLIVGTIVAAVMIFLDYQNILSKLLQNVSRSLFPAILILSLILIVSLCKKYKLTSKIIYPLVSRIDFFILSIVCSLVLFKVVSLIGYANLSSKTELINYIMLFFFVLITLRIINAGQKLGKKGSIVTDLKMVLDGKVNYEKPFLVRENAAGYDLLNRDNLAKDLIEVLKVYTADEKFVIGIEGAWGSGKTTFLNTVMDVISDDEDFVVIDDFEPWLSENKEALLKNLLNTILVKSDLAIQKKEIDSFVRAIGEIVLGKKYLKSFMKLAEDIEQDKLGNIISDINYLIDKSGKKIVFIIDNLDRLKPDNVYLVLNIVNNVLNFHNLVVILSYDEKELSKGLESLNISKYYLDKIVQKKIVLPVTGISEISSIYLHTIVTLLQARDIDYDISDIKSYTDVLAESQVGLREFKRFVNSSIIPFVFRSRKISVIDYLVIEYIHIFNRKLYETIYFDQDYFVSSDKGLELDLKYLDESKFDQDINAFFDRIKITDDLYGKLLRLSFPYVNHYFGAKKGYKDVFTNSSKDMNYKSIQKNKRVSSGKFFDSYFTALMSSDAKLIDDVEDFVENAKVNYQNSVLMESSINLLLDLNEEIQTEFLSNLSLYIDGISEMSSLVLVKLFIKNYFNFGNFRGFLTLDTKSRVSLIISELMANLDYENFQDIVDKYVVNYRQLTMMANISYWLKHSSDPNLQQTKIDYLDSRKADIIKTVLEDNINLFKRDLYNKENALQVLWYLQQNGDSEEYKRYLCACTNEETYFRVLNDFISTGTGTLGYSYAMTKGFEDLIDISLLEKFNKKVEPKNEKQRLLKDIFEKYLYGEKDEFGRVDVYLSYSVDLSAID